ncbi:MAG: glycerol-3-phosphate responsive antiterminator [Spirochaetes bacterium]|nr:glycerol-3-phosphate responsive antiterminator [Spirochaetota bacterium]
MYELLKENPIIAGIKDNKGLEKVLKSRCKLVFILYGNVLNIADIVREIKEQGKLAFIDVDLIEGFSSKDVVIQYLKKQTSADGILSSKAFMIKAARANGFYAVHRFFLIDSFSYHNLEKQINISKPDCIEVLPGCILPKVIKWVLEKIRIPLVLGGLICEIDELISALKSGATAISTTNSDLWELDLKDMI